MIPHTMVVDFAVALLLTSVACDALGFLAEENDLRIVAYWTLLLGTLAAGFAVLSGYAAAKAAAPTGVAETIVLRHRNLGIAVVACFMPLAAWRLASGGLAPRRHAAVYWLLTAVGASLLVVTAWYGGTAVFQHGVGVRVDG